MKHSSAVGSSWLLVYWPLEATVILPVGWFCVYFDCCGLCMSSSACREVQGPLPHAQGKLWNLFKCPPQPDVQVAFWQHATTGASVSVTKAGLQCTISECSSPSTWLGNLVLIYLKLPHQSTLQQSTPTTKPHSTLWSSLGALDRQWCRHLLWGSPVRAKWELHPGFLKSLICICTKPQGPQGPMLGNYMGAIHFRVAHGNERLDP